MLTLEQSCALPKHLINKELDLKKIKKCLHELITVQSLSLGRPPPLQKSRKIV